MHATAAHTPTLTQQLTPLTLSPHTHTGDQFLFVKMTSLPRTTEQVPPLQKELASFLNLAPPERAEPGVCISPTMVTTKRQRLRSHNATVAEVKRSFKASETGQALRTFLNGHDELLKALMSRDKVRVY